MRMKEKYIKSKTLSFSLPILIKENYLFGSFGSH